MNKFNNIIIKYEKKSNIYIIMNNNYKIIGQYNLNKNVIKINNNINFSKNFNKYQILLKFLTIFGLFNNSNNEF